MNAVVVTGLVCVALLAGGCVTNKAQEKMPSTMDLVVEIDSEKKVWRNTFGSESVISCYLSGDVKAGVAKDLGSGEEIQIGYLQLEDKLIIETSPGLCDGGVQVELSTQDGTFMGTLLSRSIAGYREIGVAYESR